ncbi:MAG: ATP synthase F1 subunit delta [Candidatus Omnitrophica bacterium]|nr:ATP synthase F1 subunit delta [Candidatus Omnitrophota bacterium]
MSQSQITYRYARALFELAQTQNSLDPVFVSLWEINNMLKNKTELSSFIHNPLLSSEGRASILYKVFENKIPDLLLKFLLFLNAKNRLNELSGVFESFDDLYLQKNNQMRVNLQTPFILKEDQKENIQNRLNRKHHKEISLECQTKPELLGGFRLLVEGVLFDGTIKTQLEQFRQKVLA